jgi:glycosyl transferase, family 25
MDFPAGWRSYLINLQERRDRQRSARKELGRIGWRLGPGGVTLYTATRFSDRGQFPSPSIRGCFTSHSDCLKDALTHGRPNVLMLEDDVTFATAFPILLPSILSQLETLDWDLCYFGHEDTGDIAKANTRTQEIRLCPYAGELRTTHFYLVNGRILERLTTHFDRLASGTPGDPHYGPMPVDGAINTFRLLNKEIKTLISDPKLGWQRPSRSDITPRFFDRLEYLRPAVDALRHIKNAANRWRS